MNKQQKDTLKSIQQTVKANAKQIHPKGKKAPTKTKSKADLPSIEGIPSTATHASATNEATDNLASDNEYQMRNPLAIEAANPNEDLCPTCDLPVHDVGVLCEGCESWLHYACERLSAEEITSLENDNPYTCKSCAQMQLEPAARAAVQIQTVTNASRISAEFTTPSTGCTVTTVNSSPIPTSAIAPSAIAQLHAAPTQANFTTPILTPIPVGVIVTQPIQMQHLPYGAPRVVTVPMLMPHPGMPPPGMPPPGSPLFSQAQFMPQAHTPPPGLHPPQVLSNAQNQFDDALQAQLDKTTVDFNNLQLECKTIQSEQKQLKTELESQRQENEAGKKKWAAREKQLKAREAAITAREANQNERDQQLVMLKKALHEKECQCDDLIEQNNLLKLQRACSDDIRATPGGNAPKQPANHQNSQIDSLTSTLQTSLLVATLNMLNNGNQNVAASQPATRITNVFQPARQYNRQQNRRTYHRRPHHSPEIIEYDHRSKNNRSHEELCKNDDRAELVKNLSKNLSTSTQDDEPLNLSTKSNPWRPWAVSNPATPVQNSNDGSSMQEPTNVPKPPSEHAKNYVAAHDQLNSHFLGIAKIRQPPDKELPSLL